MPQDKVAKVWTVMTMLVCIALGIALIAMARCN